VDFFAGRAWYSGDPKFPNNVYFSQIVVNDGDLEKFHQFADPFDADDPAIVADDGGVIAIPQLTMSLLFMGRILSGDLPFKVVLM
jgi:hypothetical protein